MEIPIEQTCNCEGWWEQPEYGRQPMTGLQITFEGGNIRGMGTDIIGPFTLSGTIGGGGVVTMQKRYLKKHAVEYVGSYDGEGVMQGHWRIFEDTGRWSIVIKCSVGDSESEIREISP